MNSVLNLSVFGFSGQRGTVLNFDTGAPIVATPGILFTSVPASITEGATRPISFQLRTEPTHSVTVDITTNASLSPLQGQIIFSTSNWDSPRNVTLRGVQDDDALDNTGTVTLTMTSTDPGYSGLSTTRSIPVLDDDKPDAAITVTAPSTIDEDGTATVSFALAAQPTGTVIVTGTTDDNDALHFGGDSFRSFNASNWATVQSLTLTAADDDDSDDDSYTVTLTATGADYGSVTATFSITVTDDDITPTMWMVGRDSQVLSEITLGTGGADATAAQVGSTAAQYGVSETFPAGLAWHSGALYMVGNDNNAAFLMNTTTGAASYLNSSNNDLGLPGNEAPTGLASLDGALYVINNVNDNLHTVDTDTGIASAAIGDAGGPNARSLVSNGTNLYLVHIGGTNGQFYRIDPDDATLTDIGDPNTAIHTINGMTFHNGTLYGIRDGNEFADTRLVTIDITDGTASAVDTTNDFGTLLDEARPTGLASNSPGLSGASGQTMGFVPTNIPSSVTEGSTATFNVKLNASPSEGSTTTVAVTSKHVNGVTVTGGASLTFDSSDWDTAQDVTLTGVGGGGGIVAQVVLEASGGGFDDNIMDMFVRNTPIDDSLIVGAHSLWIGEGRTKNFKVRLSSQPTGDVTVTTTSANTNKVYITAGATHTFTTSNWNADHGIDLYGYADSDSDDEHVNLTLTASGGGNTATATRTIHIYDDD